MFERKSEPTVITNGVIEKEYQELHFASDETFRKAFLTLEEVVPAEYKPFSLTPDPKYTAFADKKGINHFLLSIFISLAREKNSIEWTRKFTPQNTIAKIKEFSSSQYAEEAISLVKRIEKIVSDPQGKNFPLLLAKLENCVSFLNSAEFDAFMTETTLYSGPGKPSFTLNTKKLLERTVDTDFNFNSNEGKEILDIWRKIAVHPIVQDRYKHIMEIRRKEKQQ